METNTTLARIFLDLKERFAPSRPLTSAIQDDIDPSLLLSRAVRDAAYAEVLDALHAALSEVTTIPEKIASAESSEDSGTTPDLNSYLEAL